MKEFFMNFWEVYKGEITPILTMLIVALLTYFINTLRVNIKMGVKKDSALIGGLNAISNREDLKPEIKSMNSELVDTKKELLNLKEGFVELADLMEYIFTNTDLTPKIKENISVKVSKMKNQTADKLLTELIEERDTLKDQVKAFEIIKKEEAKVIIEKVEKKAKERIRG